MWKLHWLFHPSDGHPYLFFQKKRQLFVDFTIFIPQVIIPCPLDAQFNDKLCNTIYTCFFFTGAFYLWQVVYIWNNLTKIIRLSEAVYFKFRVTCFWSFCLLLFTCWCWSSDFITCRANFSYWRRCWWTYYQCMCSCSNNCHTGLVCSRTWWRLKGKLRSSFFNLLDVICMLTSNKATK